MPNSYASLFENQNKENKTKWNKSDSKKEETNYSKPKYEKLKQTQKFYLCIENFKRIK